MIPPSRDSSDPTRPALRWHGGKWRLAAWIISLFPPHRNYVEVYGGAASVLIRKPPAYSEIYNELDGCAVNFFRVLRDPDLAPRLVEALSLTPFARAEFEAAYEVSDDPVEEARRLVVRSFMGFGSDGFNRAVRTGFRANSNRSGTTPAHDWANYPEALRLTIERFRPVVVESRPALRVIEDYGSPDTLIYADPPYMPETRSAKSRRGGDRYHAYVHEMTIEDHEAMLAALNASPAMIVLSGYDCPLYRAELASWQRFDRDALADGGRPRVESVWLNPAAIEAREHGPLFSAIA